MYTGARLFTRPHSSLPLPASAPSIFRDEDCNSPSPAFVTSPLSEDPHTPAKYRVLDNDQRISAALVQEQTRSPSTRYLSPHLMSTTSSATTPTKSLSASPAALFLSAFSSSSSAPAPLPDDEGQSIAGYTLGATIGYGATSIIRRAYSISGGVVAVKIVRRADLVKQGNAPLARKRLEHEASVWASLSHEHILPLFSAVHTSYADFFITLYCPAGSLFDILKRDGHPALPQDDAGMMFRQVVRGLRYLHEVAMFVHRDMKLENVLVDEMGVCRIGDFGMARRIGECEEDDDEFEMQQQQIQFEGAGVHRSATVAGGAPPSRRQGRSSFQHASTARHSAARHRNSTSSAQPTLPTNIFQLGSLPYAAPELLLSQTAESLCPHPSQDIWALGVMLYTLLRDVYPSYIVGAYETPKDVGRGAERVLQGCLERCIANRWTIARVDEVAWGIGWGVEGDDVTEEEEEQIQSSEEWKKQTTSESRSRSIRTSISSNHDYPRSRPSLEAAERRSSSRANRSLSRAPVSPRSTSRSISLSRSRRPPSPSLSVLHNAIMGSGVATPPMSRSSSSSAKDSAILASPSSFIERGRRPLKNRRDTTSRSPSPSLTPGTPADFLSPRRYASLDIVCDHIEDDIEKESSRGRKGGIRNIRSPLRTEQLFSVPDAEEDLVEPDWLVSAASSSKGRAFVNDDDLLSTSNNAPLVSLLSHTRPVDNCRAGSVPPTSGPAWISRHGSKIHTPQRYPLDPFLDTSGAPPTTSSATTRSKSADYARRPTSSTSSLSLFLAA
ncbi:kinase-like domain-containing protein [Cyathus striatus]|nr:kinase-like domain-containing protein [Cyathus striatus]